MRDPEILHDELKAELHRIAIALERLAACAEDGVLKMKDVDRAKVYSTHLGEKLREPKP